MLQVWQDLSTLALSFKANACSIVDTRRMPQSSCLHAIGYYGYVRRLPIPRDMYLFTHSCFAQRLESRLLLSEGTHMAHIPLQAPQGNPYL